MAYDAVNIKDMWHIAETEKFFEAAKIDKSGNNSELTIYEALDYILGNESEDKKKSLHGHGSEDLVGHIGSLSLDLGREFDDYATGLMTKAEEMLKMASALSADKIDVYASGENCWQADDKWKCVSKPAVKTELPVNPYRAAKIFSENPSMSVSQLKAEVRQHALQLKSHNEMYEIHQESDNPLLSALISAAVVGAVVFLAYHCAAAAKAMRMHVGSPSPFGQPTEDLTL